MASKKQLTHSMLLVMLAARAYHLKATSVSSFASASLPRAFKSSHRG